jgi:hypothetical protein
MPQLRSTSLRTAFALAANTHHGSVDAAGTSGLDVERQWVEGRFSTLQPILATRPFLDAIGRRRSGGEFSHRRRRRRNSTAFR